MFEYPAEPLVTLKDFEIIDTVATGEGKEHEGEHHLGVGPALGGSKGEMAFDALRKAQCVSEIEVEGEAGERGHACWFLFFFILVREESLWHT
jgi:hypothetical protein